MSSHHSSKHSQAKETSLDLHGHHFKFPNSECQIRKWWWPTPALHKHSSHPHPRSFLQQTETATENGNRKSREHTTAGCPTQPDTLDKMTGQKPQGAWRKGARLSGPRTKTPATGQFLLDRSEIRVTAQDMQRSHRLTCKHGGKFHKALLLGKEQQASRWNPREGESIFSKDQSLTGYTIVSGEP